MRSNKRRTKKSVARAAAVIPPPKTFHIDKRAGAIASQVAGDDDDLLTTNETADWLQVSSQWLEIGRTRGYGPPYDRLSAKVIRYRRGKVRAWLDERSHRGTAEYQSAQP
jgi:hypothetical protein